jgi:hypothetical protein
MKTYTVSITGNTSTLESLVYYDEIAVKGDVEFTFDFTGLEIDLNNILRIDIDYGDSSDIERFSYDVGVDHETKPITYEIALYGAYRPKSIFKHVYRPLNSTYYSQLSASILLQYGNFDHSKIIIPIKIAQHSYYDALGSINILDTQIISTTASDIFCVVEDEDGDIINLVLS